VRGPVLGQGQGQGQGRARRAQAAVLAPHLFCTVPLHRPSPGVWQWVVVVVVVAAVAVGGASPYVWRPLALRQ
jgi:hypothetical protein